jgi:adenylate cyclase
MGTEIERRFRIDTAHLRKAHPNLPAGRYFEQGYLSLDPVVRIRVEGPIVRLRPEGPIVGELKAELTIKGKGLVTRPEFPFPVHIQDAQPLLALCEHRVTKIRYDLHYGDAHWEIDEFLDAHAGLWIAEIELKHIMQRFDCPTWLRNEVSHDPQYTNVYLAQHPEHFWEKSAPV